MKKKKLCLALGALSVVAATPAISSERAGIAAKVNPAVEQLSKIGSRVLFVGSDIFRDETIRTDDAGQTHLMFLDQSSLTIGPSSEIVIDSFVYDPISNKGELSMSAQKGLLRFVGGALSKTGNVTVKTPVGNLGIRGAVVLIEMSADGSETTAHLIYGNELSFTPLSTGITHTVHGHEQSIRVTSDGHIERSPLSPEKLQRIHAKLQGPQSGTPLNRRVTIPDNLSGWLRQLATQNTFSNMQKEENLNADLLNHDIDSLSS